MIEIKNLYAGYDKNDVLKDVSADIFQGSFTGIIGRNGAGKSTLLKNICALLPFSKGEIKISGQALSAFSRERLAQTLAFMPQSVSYDFAFTVRDFVMLGRYPYMNFFKIPSRKDFEAVEQTLKFTGAARFSNKNINELSGGEKQRVLIAQTIAQDTGILIFDEPTAHLDIGSQNDILELLRTLNKRNKKTIIATLHDLNAAGEFCDNLILLDGGRVKNSGSPQKVLNFKDIEEVYKTTVIVKENPVSKKPYVIPYRKNED
ncbi:MAG: ABC transporter ATP-binding protein [Endomicrobium sp.]|jgi:iron complex transport system ATP-binding protein|nr:ABC transporter ATP-binding protein [Endomicrobium sp.]